ncbi:hypothetical protein [Pontibacter sp. G13]|uniref:hypothetical protein n=1 Tax=Pontibacter sp. G13 TaxID=3074898 RepID=UPI00288B644F|nr:hypothetical protein [Pontibacter sp. G13]WNJ16420.1 hypothetical protein RJD25_16265 [Pontibacter sp. G13]
MKSNKYLILKGCAGLGNRLLALAHAIEYAKATDRILHVDWTDGMYNAPEENVFLEFFTLEDVNWAPTLPPHLKEESVEVFPKVFKGNLDKNIYEFYRTKPGSRWNLAKGWMLTELKESWNWWDGLMVWLLGHQAAYKDFLPSGSTLSKSLESEVVIFADYTPPMLADTIHQHIRLAPKIQSIIDDFASDHFDSDVIGVHVRNTDMKPKNSLISLIHRLKETHTAQAPIFLATDHQPSQELFKVHFEQVILTDKFLPEDQVDGGLHKWVSYHGKDQVAAPTKQTVLLESIRDMWLLSKCPKLYYQGNSSFSRLAVTLMGSKKNATNWDE